MAEEMLKMIHRDVEKLKNDIEVIKHILYEEGELTDKAKERLEKARKIPFSKYAKL